MPIDVVVRMDRKRNWYILFNDRKPIQFSKTSTMYLLQVMSASQTFTWTITYRKGSSVDGAQLRLMSHHRSC